MRLAALLLAATAAGAEEPRTFGCAVVGRPGVVGVTLWAEGGSHCVAAPDLRGRAPPCAPDGGWGLSAPGSDVAVAQATEARGLRHDGGWLFARVTGRTFYASAAEGTRPPLALELGGGTFWRLSLDLPTRSGAVQTRDGWAALACAEERP